MWQTAFRIGVLALASACAGSSGSSSSAPEAHAARKDVVIQFGDMSVEPAVAKVAPGGSVAWVSVASSYRGVISFPESIAAHFTCKELRPNFFADGGRIQSIPVGDASENLVLPCPLQPGTYEYRVDLYPGVAGMVSPGVAMGAPLRSLEGRLVVE